MKRKILLLLGLGILIRILLALGTFHSDIEHFLLAGRVIAQGNILNFYDSSKIVFNYPPLVYFFLGPLSYILTIPFNKFIYLPFDLGVAFLLFKLFKEPKEKLWALVLWMFNPLVLFATYMMGQFDIIPTFLVISAFYLVFRKKSYLLAAVLLGLGASFKIFPFLFLVPLALLSEKWPDRLKIVGLGLLTYFVTILPFINSSGFRATALVASQTTKSLYAALPISGGEAIVLFPLAITLLYIFFWYRTNTPETLWQKFFVLLLVFFVFTHYHPQWLLWLTPFLIIDLIKSRFNHWPLTVLSLTSWTGLLTFFDPGLSVRLFAPVFPALKNLPGIWEIFGINVDMNFARSLLQTLFVAPALYWIYYYFPKKET